MFKFGDAYLLLALRINKYIKGYVDFYYGPEKIRQIVENESLRSPNKLMKDSKVLVQQLETQGFDKKHEHYLEKMLTAMRASIELLNGYEISLEDQFLKLYDVALKPINESKLRNLKTEYENAYQGPGSLEERMSDLRVKRRVPEEKVLTFFEKALKLVRKQTVKKFSNILPEGEHISLDAVEDSKEKIKWSYYNWYLGNYHSRIEINPKYAIYWTSFLSSASHEGYPGHHTEFILNERKLYHELGQFEHSILILHSPKMIISEGIAELANSMLYSDKESTEISLRLFCPDPSKEASLEKLIMQNKVRAKVPLFWYNFAYHAVVDKYDEEELIQFGKSIELFSEEDLKVEIKRLLTSAYSKNAFLYNLGKNIITQKFGKNLSVKEFKNLLYNPILPSDLI